MNHTMPIQIRCFKVLDYFMNIKNSHNQKILILGNMNELGEDTNQPTSKLLKQIEKYIFKYVILSGEFFQKSIKNKKSKK